MLISWEGSSAHKKESRNTVLPRLKSLVDRPRSSRKLSVLACEMLPRSRSRAKKAINAQRVTFQSSLLIRGYM